MKKIVLVIAAAFMMASTVVAQDDKNAGQRPPKVMNETEMVQHRTNEVVKRYKLNDKQAKQLLELNKKQAEQMKAYERDLEKIMTADQYQAYKQDKMRHHAPRGGMRPGGHRGQKPNGAKFDKREKSN